MNVQCIAFAGPVCVASGTLAEVAAQVKKRIGADAGTTVLIFDASTSEPVEVDFRGTIEEVTARLATREAVPAETAAAADTADTSAAKTPGRPRLGVTAREVTLLPRHWDWLNEQPGGASVTLRKLVEEARKATAGEVQKRRAQEACYRFMNTMAGNEAGFEEALRALYAGDSARFTALTEAWPYDVRDHARRLAADCFTG